MTIYKDKQFQLIISGLLVIIFLRFFYLQIYQHKKYENRAGANSIRKISLHAPRGIIFARSGIPLVDNLQIYDDATQLASLRENCFSIVFRQGKTLAKSSRILNHAPRPRGPSGWWAQSRANLFPMISLICGENLGNFSELMPIFMNRQLYGAPCFLARGAEFPKDRNRE